MTITVEESTTWLTSSQVALVAGKGGVGKSTVSAAMALAAARAGAVVDLVVTDDRDGIARLFGLDTRLRYEPVEATVDRGDGRVRIRSVTAEPAMLDYLDQRGMAKVAKRFLAAGAIEVLAAMTPGIKDLLVLGKVRQMAAEDGDLVVVDAPAAGHALSMLRAPKAIAEVVDDGALREQADLALRFLADDAASQLVLVSLPETTPVTETAQLAFAVEDEIGIALGPVVLNGLWSDWAALDADTDPVEVAAAVGMTLDDAAVAALRASAGYFGPRLDRQRAARARLAEVIPLPVIEVPRLATARLGPEGLGVLADALVAS